MIYIILVKAKQHKDSVFSVITAALAWLLNRELSMNYEKPLTNLHRMYSAGKLSRKDLEGGIFKYLQDHFEKYKYFRGDQERWNEFLSWLYPRISRAVDRYREQGSSLDAYFNALVRGASKEYFRREASRYLTEYVCWQDKAEEMQLHENEAVYTEYKSSTPVPVNLKPKQVLFLFLKSYFFANDEMIDRVSEITGVEVRELKKMIDELRQMRSGRESKIMDLQERLYGQYYRCLAYQKRMKSVFDGTETYEVLKARFERASNRFQSMKKRLAGMRKGASNRMIAEVMKIPKGTVDSGLSAAKNYLAGANGVE